MNAESGQNPPRLISLIGVAESELRWRILRLMNLFRTIAAGLLIVLYYQHGPHLFGSTHPALYMGIAIGWLGFGLLSSFTVQWRKPPLAVQVYLHLLLDLAAIILLIHASGGQASGLSALLFISVVASSTLLRERLALAYAAMASIALLVEQFFSNIENFTTDFLYTNAGISGVILFVTAFVGARVAERFRESEALAVRRGVDLQNLSQVNDIIIHNMQTGVVVLDAENRVRQINESAMDILGFGSRPAGGLEDTGTPLAGLVTEWRAGNEPRASLRLPGGTAFVRLQRLGGEGAVMIFLEDAQAANQQVQQAKLAALGRLTASIAHEIRNPIGAISHAGQLLAETDGLGTDERKFLRIIRDQSNRVNEIIENILQLGRRQELRPEPLEITSWLRDFVMEFCDVRGLDLDCIELETPGEAMIIRMDPGHLRQVLNNLLENALTHAGLGESGELAVLRLSRTASGNAVYLDIVDFGPGIPAEIANQIFEPFYTHSRSGTGLGLFIARELCECNHAALNYGKDGEGRSCFRIMFQDEASWLS